MLLAVSLANKSIHLICVMGIIGGLLVAYFVMAPTLGAEASSDEARLLWKRWGIAMAIFWLLALGTGFFNMVLVTNAIPRVNAHYQMLLGIKMALAVAMFVATMLVGHPMPALARLLRDRAPWLALLLVI